VGFFPYLDGEKIVRRASNKPRNGENTALVAAGTKGGSKNAGQLANSDMEKRNPGVNTTGRNSRRIRLPM